MAGTSVLADARRRPRPPPRATCGRRLVLLAYVLLFAGAVYAFGVDPVLGVLVGALNVVCAVSFFRHLAFAVSAARWARADLLAAGVDVDGYTPSVAVLVGCRNEEPVVDGMMSPLPALDYPADRLTLVVVDDGSDDRTGDLLDPGAAQEPRLRVLAGAVPVACPTDGNPVIQVAKLAATGLRPLLQVVVVTDALGGRAARKPHPAGLLAVAGRLGVPADRLLVIGDRPGKDVAVAATVGARAIRVWQASTPPRPASRRPGPWPTRSRQEPRSR